LFASQGEVEAQWAVVDPILDDATPLHSYEPGTWGPAEADALVHDQGGWRVPTITQPTRRAA
jgi:glucose-6-phosphate 1-dehydrogenase